jgi:hypothetical protein
VLSWYQGIDLDQLENLREDGQSNIDPAKLHWRAYTIVECTNTDKIFDAGESDDDGAADDMEFEASGFMEACGKTPEGVVDGSALPSPNSADFILAARTTDGPIPKPANASADS